MIATGTCDGLKAAVGRRPEVTWEGAVLVQLLVTARLVKLDEREAST